VGRVWQWEMWSRSPMNAKCSPASLRASVKVPDGGGGAVQLRPGALVSKTSPPASPFEPAADACGISASFPTIPTTLPWARVCSGRWAWGSFKDVGAGLRNGVTVEHESGLGGGVLSALGRFGLTLFGGRSRIRANSTFPSEVGAIEMNSPGRWIVGRGPGAGDASVAELADRRMGRFDRKGV
jgi:hypothetical protein